MDPSSSHLRPPPCRLSDFLCPPHLQSPVITWLFPPVRTSQVRLDQLRTVVRVMDVCRRNEHSQSDGGPCIALRSRSLRRALCSVGLCLVGDRCVRHHNFAFVFLFVTQCCGCVLLVWMCVCHQLIVPYLELKVCERCFCVDFSGSFRLRLFTVNIFRYVC